VLPKLFTVQYIREYIQLFQYDTTFDVACAVPNHFGYLFIIYIRTLFARCCDCSVVSCSAKKYYLTEENVLVSTVKYTCLLYSHFLHLGFWV